MGEIGSAGGDGGRSSSSRPSESKAYSGSMSFKRSCTRACECCGAAEEGEPAPLRHGEREGGARGGSWQSDDGVRGRPDDGADEEVAGRDEV